MKQRRLGRTGLVVSEICLGTMTFGNQADERTSHAILDRAYEAGVDFLDIAEVYPVPPDFKYAGRSEEFVGRWMADKPRDGLFIATKVAGPGAGWFLAPVRANHTALDRHHIERAVDGSLRRLGTDYIDLYQTHWPDRGVPIDETLEALSSVVEAGKVRYVGCSNETAYGLTKSLGVSEAHGTARYETIQNNFSLLNRRFEDELANVCRRERVSLLPYSPIAGGVLSGKYQGGAFPEGARFSRYRANDQRGRIMTRRFINEKTLASTERFAKIAAEFVKLKVDVIVTYASAPVLAAKHTTMLIPIVFAAQMDPVGAGVVASLAHPGGNVTGLSIQTTDTADKRLELLREVVSNLGRLAIMANPDAPGALLEMREVQEAGRTLDLEVTTLEIRQTDDIAPAIEALKGHADALYVATDPLVFTNRIQINTLAQNLGLPTIYGSREYVEAGALMSYGPNFPDLFRRAAEFVDKILRGTKPADIPVEEPTKFDLAINLTTAKALGLEVPHNLLVLADELIE